MKMEQIELELQKYATEREHSWGRINYVIRKVFDDWAMNELMKLGHSDFKMMYMPFLMNISLEGNTNKEIAKKGRVTKQAMSKVVKELEAMGLIEVFDGEEDKRSVKIYLTNKGKKMVHAAKKHVAELSEQYKKIIGNKNYDIMIDGMLKIIAFHDNLKLESLKNKN
jgi:DNA-binding MarR family transcriptional regulator